MTATVSSVRRSLPTWSWWAVSASLAVLFLYPVYVMLSQSLKSPGEAAAVPPTLYPHHLSGANYADLSGNSDVGFLQHVLNSVLVSVGTTVAVVVLTTLAGFGFARLRFRGSNVLFFGALATFMIPFQAIITPLYLVLQQIGLVNSLLGLTLVYTTFGLPFGLFLMRNSFAALPSSIEEAALVDGCGSLRAMVQVLLPLALPGVISTALFTFFNAWNEFFAALILLTSESRFTLPVTLTVLSSNQFGTLNWGILQAGVAVTVVPCLVIYLVLQRYYVGGLVAGAIK